MRVIVAAGVAANLGALDVLASRREIKVMHGHQNAPLTWLQTVAHIGQRAVHDGAHGVGQVAGVQLLLNRHFNNMINWRGCGWSWFTHVCNFCNGKCDVVNDIIGTQIGTDRSTKSGTNLGTQFKRLF